MNKSGITVVLVAVILFAAGMGVGRYFFQPSRPAPWPAASPARPLAGSALHPAQRRILYWASPMDPSIHSDHPMKDSMNMPYVPVYASVPGAASQPALQLDPRMVQALGVRIVPVRPRLMGHEIATVGTITVDENRLVDLNLRVSGWVVELDTRAVGDRVRKGQQLAMVYAPELLAAENEYLIARRGSRVVGSGIERAARERLQLLGMTTADVATLAARGRAQRLMSVRAPLDGTVLALGVRSGGYVTPGTTLFKLADLSRVWAQIALYSYQVPWVRLHDPVQLHLADAPDKVWAGHVSFLYPTVDPANRTIAARVPLVNGDGRLRPGVYVQATLQGTPRRALAVPSDAILRMAHGNYVMVATGGGHFAPTEVALGPQSQGWVAVRRGLKNGDQVAESAQFLLYAESQLQQIKSRMLGPAMGSTGAAP